jgi:DNA mismatch repair protein MutL
LRAETEQPAARLPWSEFSRKVEEPPWPAPPSEHATPQISYARAVAPELSPVDDVEDLPQVTIHQPSVRTDDVTRLVPMPIPDTHGGFPDGLADSGPVNLSSLSDLRPLGQIQASFIVAAGRDGLWIIDQHVAHERILFEKVLKQRAQGKVERQQLLMPVLIELSPAQTVEYARIADELNSCGFDTELFGARTISVKATPAGLALTEIDKLMFEVLEIAERELRRTSIGDVRRALAASIACRAAIKINTRLDQSKMEWLLTALAATDCPMSCPHGRPIALRYSTRDILKGFHRI